MKLFPQADMPSSREPAFSLADDDGQAGALIDHVCQMAWIADPVGNIHWYNARWYGYTGTTLEAMRELGWSPLHHPDHCARVVERLRHCFANGCAWEDTFPLRGAHGDYRWFLSRAQPIHDESGRISHWLGTHTDVTAQKVAEDALRELNDGLEQRVAERTGELEAMNARLQTEMAERKHAEDALRHAQKMEAIGQLTGGIAHDFNNMLTGVLGALDLMKRRLAAGRLGDIERYITAATSSANRAAALTHRLLAFARRQALDQRAVDVNRMVRSMEDLLRRTLGESIDLHIDLDEGIPDSHTDEHQLENALLNLVINARDAMPEGGQLTISTRAAIVRDGSDGMSPGSYLRLSVTDSGCGMSDELMERVFDPFFTTKPTGQGTGLGLSMVYGFVSQTGGYVRIDSREGRGTRMDLYLPQHVDPPGCPQRVIAAQSAPRAVRGERILVVEDQSEVRMLVVDVLRELGYSVLQAADSREAIPLLESGERIDLLVSDVGLPGLNGRQLAEIARERRPGLRVLFMTGYARNAQARDEVMAVGMAMLSKPFNLDELARQVRALIDRPPG